MSGSERKGQPRSRAAEAARTADRPSPEQQVDGRAAEVPSEEAAAQAAPDAGQAPEVDAVDGDEAAGSSAVQSDIDELVAVAAQRDEYLALAQRTQADFENYRKRMAREAAGAETRGLIRLVRELLPALDNLERALAAGEGAAPAAAADGAQGDADDDGGLAQGVRLVQSELAAALGRLGIESFTPRGERFDPECHEAIAQQPVEGAESGTVAEVYEPGYRLGESVIRPARVVVAA